MTDPIHRPLVEDHVYADDVGRDQVLKDRVEAHERQLSRVMADLAQVLKTEAGQSLMMRILDHCGVYRSTLLTTDTVQYAKDEGKRGVALWLIREISQLGAEVYPTLLINHARRAQKDADVEAASQKAAKS